MISRNDPCPCGSGRKYKRCCALKNSGNVAAASASHIENAFGLLNQGRIQEAVAIAEGLVQQNQLSPEVFEILGAGYYQLGQLPAAEQAMLHLLKWRPNSTETHSNLCYIQQQLGKFQEAIEHGKQAVKLAPADAQSHNNLANVYRDMGDSASAESHYRKAHKLQPDNVLILANLGCVLQESGDMQQAQKIFEQAITVNADFAFAYSALGMLLLDDNQPQQAQQYLEKAVQLEPNNPDFINSLGVFWQRNNNDNEARKLFEQALGIAADYDGALINLATLEEHADPARAIELYRQAVDINPYNPASRHNLAVQLLVQGNSDEAEQQFKAALELDPNYAKAYAGIAHIKVIEEKFRAAKAYLDKAYSLQSQDSYIDEVNARYLSARRIDDDAIDAWNRVIAQQPENIIGYLGLAEQFKKMGKYDEAHNMFQQAAEVDPEDPINYLGMAGLEERYHHLDEAEQLIEKSLQLSNGNTGAANVLLATIYRRRKQPEKALQLLDSIDEQSLKNKNLLMVSLFERGKVLDKLKRHAEAFDAYVAANDIKNAVLGIRYNAKLGEMKDYYQVFNADWVARLPKKSTDGLPQPIFIVGFPRSGTTLLEQIIASHPDVIAGDELIFVPELSKGKASEILHSDNTYPECLAELSSEEMQKASDGFREYYLRRADETVLHGKQSLFTDKLPLNLSHLPLIRLMFPQAPIIHIIRHPLDSCLSAFSSNFTSGNRYTSSIQDTARCYASVMKLAEHYKQTLNMRYMEIKYEDLVDHQEQKTHEILEFLGLDWNDACIEFHKNKRVSRTASYEQVTQKIYTSSRFRYKAYYEKLESVFPILQETIDRFGYTIEKPDQTSAT